MAAALESPSKTAIPIKSNFNLTAAKHKRYSATGNTKLASAIGLHDEATALAIRNIESAAMEREEEYRREWQAERGIGHPKSSKAGIFQSTPFTGNAKQMPVTPTPGKLADSISTPKLDEKLAKASIWTKSPKHVEMSMDAAISYLSSSRRIQLADRYVRRDYFWRVNSEFAEGKEVLVLRWRDLDSDNVVGHLYASDIQNITFTKGNAQQLDISVGTAPRPLVGTGGRAVVSMLFSSEVECKKYGKSLLAISRGL